MAKNKKTGYDLAFVDPDRRDLVRRRISVLDKFLEAPGRRAAEQGAAQLGLGLTRFYALVKIWRAKRRPEELDGTKRNRTTPLRMPERMQAIIRTTEAELPDTSARQIEMLIAEVAAKEELEMHSASTIRAFVQKLRREDGRSRPQEDGIILDFCALEISVPDGDQRTLPIAAFVLDPRRQVILGAALDLEANPRVASRALVNAMDHQDLWGGGTAPAIMVDISDDPAWVLVLEALVEAGIERRGRQSSRIMGGRVTKAVMGPRALGITLRPNFTGRSCADRRARGIELTLQDAEDLLRARLRVDGLRNGDTSLTNDADRQLRSRLCDVVTTFT